MSMCFFFFLKKTECNILVTYSVTDTLIIYIRIPHIYLNDLSIFDVF